MGKHTTVSASVSIDDYFAKQMADPEFAQEYAALDTEFGIINQLVALRIKRKISQRDLAEKIGTQQPSIARFERRRVATDLGFLRRVANALDADVTVSLVPRRSKSARQTVSEKI